LKSQTQTNHNPSTQMINEQTLLSRYSPCSTPTTTFAPPVLPFVV